MVSRSPWRKRIKVALLVVTGLFALACFGLAGLWWFYGDRPFFDDGPFHGVATSAPPSEHAIQRMQLPRGSVLEVFPPDRPEKSPIVVLRTSRGDVVWSIYAEGLPETNVRSIHFDSYSYIPLRGITVDGLVDWTYGREHTVWILAPSGRLREYWYSW